MNMEKWANKVAVVTGASEGIGAATTLALLKEGLIVVGLARSVDKIRNLSASTNLHAIKTDLTKEDDIINAFKWIKENVGPVHILINNAAVLLVTQLIDGKTEFWKNMFDLNVMGLCISTREAVQDMRLNNLDGHIIHINSVVGHMVPNVPYLSVVPASKHAVTALTETLRHELNSIGSKIKISSVSPGLVQTNTFKNSCRASGPSEATKAYEKLFENAPGLEQSDVVDAILYILSTPSHVQIHELLITHVEDTV